MKEYLKKRLPEFQQQKEDLDGFLDAAGDFLQDAKEAIEHFDFSHDYKKGTQYNVEKYLNDRGLQLPRALPLDVKRTILRDVAEILLKNGTRDGLQHALRLIGFNATVEEGWLPSPRSLRKGFVKNPFTGDLTRYDITKYVYTEMLYGREKVTEDGVFFEGYQYFDTFKKNVIEKLPILGETYKNFPENDIAVSKTPYVIVKFEEGDFNVIVDTYTNPDTGQEYSYSTDEEFALVNEVIDYFIVGGNRPTTLRVIIIVSLQEIEDEIDVNDHEYLEQHTYNPDGNDDLEDVVNLQSLPDKEIGVDVQTTAIGRAPMNIGRPGLFATTLSFTQPPPIGFESGELLEVDMFEAVTTNKTYTAKNIKFPLHYLTDVSIGVNLDEVGEYVDVYTERVYNSGEKEYLGRFFDGDTITLTNTENDQYHAIELVTTDILADENGEDVLDLNGEQVVVNLVDGGTFDVNIEYQEIDLTW